MKRLRKIKKISSAVLRGVYFIIPFAVAGGVLISLSYITDIIFSSDALYGLGNENPVAVVLKALGSLTFSLMLPVLSAIIAVEIAEKNAFTAGFVGGFLAQNGATLMLPFGDTTAVSGFLGAIVSGIGAGYIYILIKKLSKNPQKSESTNVKTLFLPAASVLLTGLLMLSINPLAGLINTSISAILMAISEFNPIAFGAVLGIMTAIDLGGAFSKAAFIFATAALASGEYTAMAAVMSAGMAISLSVAICSLVFKIKFSKKEARLARLNLVFGILDITEAVIPIAAKNPSRVIPACTVAAAVSGALSAGFGCTLIAPFGGFLVLPLVGKPLFFAVSVLTGSLIGAVILGIIKKEPKTKFTEPVPVEAKK